MTQAEESKCQTHVDKGTKNGLQDSFKAWLQICDEADPILKQKSLQEADLRQYFERQKETWEPTARKTEAFADKARLLAQISHTRGQILEQDWGTLLSLAKENRWSEDRENVTKVWMELNFKKGYENSSLHCGRHGLRVSCPKRQKIKEFE